MREETSVEDEGGRLRSGRIPRKVETLVSFPDEDCYLPCSGCPDFRGASHPSKRGEKWCWEESIECYSGVGFFLVAGGDFFGGLGFSAEWSAVCSSFGWFDFCDFLCEVLAKQAG